MSDQQNNQGQQDEREQMIADILEDNPDLTREQAEEWLNRVDAMNQLRANPAREAMMVHSQTDMGEYPRWLDATVPMPKPSTATGGHLRIPSTIWRPPWVDPGMCVDPKISREKLLGTDPSLGV